jgi:hypothetical protein
LFIAIELAYGESIISAKDANESRKGNKKAFKGSKRMRLFIYVLALIVAFFGLRHLIAMFIGFDQDGPLKPGQRLCHFISLLILWGSCLLSIYFFFFWMLVIGVFAEYIFRNVVVWSGKIKH